MMSLNYYLSRSTHGDKNAAYEAAKLMHLEKYSEVMVQAQLRKAASMGNVDAMRWLGFLGFCGNLVMPESTIAKVSYYNTYEQAYNWFVEGSKQGDALSAFVVGTCLRHGIGTELDEQRSETLLTSVASQVSIDAVIPIIYLINTLHPASTMQHKHFDSKIIDEILK